MSKNQSNKVLKSALKSVKPVDEEKKQVRFSDPLEMAGLSAVKVAKPKVVSDRLGVCVSKLGGIAADDRNVSREWSGDNPFLQNQLLPERFRDQRNTKPSQMVAPREVARFYDRGIGAINPVTWQYVTPFPRIKNAPSAILRSAAARSLVVNCAERGFN